jgi:thiol-disulfide isomerase/thioredoxin
MDLNHDKQIQSLLCYHYTIRHAQCGQQSSHFCRPVKAKRWQFIAREQRRPASCPAQLPASIMLHHYASSVKILRYLLLVLWLAAGVGEALAAEPAGIGVVLGSDGQSIVVKDILADSPAARSKNIGVGDRIVAVAQGNEASVQVQGGNLRQALSSLRGPKGTTVRLTIVRAGAPESRPVAISFVRGELQALARWGDGVLLTNGTKAPEIQMVRLENGKPEHLSDYGGKIVVLEFWATWCGPCQAAMADLQTYFSKYPNWKENVVLVTASVDDTEHLAREHLKAKGWNKTHNVWVGSDAIRAYHVDGVPTTYVIDQAGKIAAADRTDIPGIVNRLSSRLP